MKDLRIIPTIHSETPAYTAVMLADFIEETSPQVIFMELPADWTGDECAAVQGQEDQAVELCRQRRPIEVINVDLPGRNRLAASLDLYRYEDEVWKFVSGTDPVNPKVQRLRDACTRLYRELYEPAGGVCFEHVRSPKFQRGIRRKWRLFDRMVAAVSRERPELAQYRRLSTVFHDAMRDEVMAFHCVRHMEHFERGVLLVGAEHVDLADKIRKYRVLRVWV